jgi:AbiU2
MSEVGYWKDFEFISGEVDRAIELYYTSKELNKLVAENKNLLDYFNEAPSFWIIQRYALESAFFITLAKIFDPGKDALSIHKLIRATIKNPNYFSKKSLATRKSEGKEKPEWLDQYMDEVTEPAVIELRALKKSLSPFTKQIDAVYRPIRNQVIAHNITRDIEAVGVLFAKTNQFEIEQLLYFLRDLMQCLWQLYHNGIIPTLGKSSREYEDRIKVSTKKALSKLFIDGK